MSEAEIKSGSEAASVDCDQTKGDDASSHPEDADTDLIVRLLAALDGPDDAVSASLAAFVQFESGSEDLMVPREEGQSIDELMTHATESDGGTPVAEGPNVTPSAETPQSVGSGSMPTEALPIKIIFEDDGSASGSLI